MNRAGPAPRATSSSAATPSGAVAVLMALVLEAVARGVRAPRDRPRRPGSCQCDERLHGPIACRQQAGVRAAAPLRLGGSVTSMAKTEPLPGCERTRPDGPAISPDVARWRGQGQGRGCARARHCRADGIPRRSPRSSSSGMPIPVSQTSMLSMPARRRQPEQHLAVLGVFQGVRKQVADHLLEQARIAVDRQAARDHTQDQPSAPARDR